MDNIITELFTSSDHEVVPSTNLLLFRLKEKYNYWVIIFRDSLMEIIDEQTSLFLEAKELIVDRQFDKNANLLVLYKVENLSLVNKDELLKVEEDLYHFKKCVIYYTEEELKGLKDRIEQSSIKVNIESLILDEDVFEQHKLKFDDNIFESLLYRFAHKLPFLKIDVKQANNLQSLEEINKAIVADNKLNEILEREIFTLTNQAFEALGDDELLNKLKIKPTNED
jgi:hypothetical protein